MRAAISALAVAAALFVAGAAMAAPTCLDRQGGMARCGTEGAMPVGWSPPADVQQAHLAAEPPADDGQLIGLTVFLAGVFGLLALMPDFEGRWDRQGGDDDAPRG